MRKRSMRSIHAAHGFKEASSPFFNFSPYNITMSR